MRVLIKIGSVKFNDKVFNVGEVADLPEETVKALLPEKIVEVVLMETEVGEVKIKEVKKVEKVKKVEEAKVEEKIEPSIDWTRKELNEYAVSKGVKEPEKLYNKQDVLDAIKEVK